jgi:serine phosphatase RsbU (regulator of sigma subunit)
MNTSIAEIDLLSIMKSSQAISGSLVLEDLIKRLLQSLLENAAAQRGFLILKGDAELVVEATTDTAGNGIVMHDTPVEARDDLSRSIVRYVERTKERVVLKDASHAGQFQTDPYVVRARPKSVLCMPIVRQQKLIGVLYLENNLATDVFTAKRCRTLDLLSVQAAISLENARLYDTLEGRVKERTQQLKASFDRVERTQAALDAELRDAATYVRSLLPAPLTSGMVRSDWRYVPSAHLGGDALGYSFLEDGRFTFYVIDVAGHGLASALLSISILTALHGRHLAGADYGDPGSVLKALNDAFPRSTNGGRHFTMWYGVLDPKTRSLTCSNGGHPSAVICGADGTRREAGEVGIMLGILPALDFATESVNLREGDRIYLFSDGAYEIQTKSGPMLDYEQFADQLVTATTNPAERVAPMLTFATTTSGGPLEDDFTMLCVELASPAKRLFSLARGFPVAGPNPRLSDGPDIGIAALHLTERPLRPCHA